MIHKLSEADVRARVSERLSNEEVDELIEQYVDAASPTQLPDMNIIERLVQQGDGQKLLRVAFTLEDDYYEALATYYGEEGQSANDLVKKAIEEFVRIL